MFWCCDLYGLLVRFHVYLSLATRVPSTGKSQGPSLCIGLFISDNKSVTNKNVALMGALISPMKALSSGIKRMMVWNVLIMSSNLCWTNPGRWLMNWGLINYCVINKMLSIEHDLIGFKERFEVIVEFWNKKDGLVFVIPTLDLSRRRERLGHLYYDSSTQTRMGEDVG